MYTKIIGTLKIFVIYLCVDAESAGAGTAQAPADHTHQTPAATPTALPAPASHCKHYLSL